MQTVKTTNNFDLKTQVPSFPKFRPFTTEDKQWYIPYYSQFEPYADFAFGNLLIWLNFNDDLKVSELNNNLIFTFTNSLTDGSLTMTVLGVDDIDGTLRKLFTSGICKELSFVPAVTYEGINEKHSFSIEEERDSFDYILETNRMAKMLGSESRKLRRIVRTSIREYGDTIILRELEMNDDTINFMINNLHTWDKAFTLTKNDVDLQEVKALNTSLDISREIDNRNFSIYIDGKLEGFILYQVPPQEGFVILNHIKTSYNFRYIFDFMLFAFAARVTQSGIKYINFEQDLGLEGLRDHKLGLKPIGFLKKYSIKPL